MFTIILDGAGQLSGNFRRFGEVAAHSASQCIHQDTFHLMDCLGGQSVIVQVTHKGTEHLGCPVHGYSSRTSKHESIKKLGVTPPGALPPAADPDTSVGTRSRVPGSGFSPAFATANAHPAWSIAAVASYRSAC